MEAAVAPDQPFERPGGNTVWGRYLALDCCQMPDLFNYLYDGIQTLDIQQARRRAAEAGDRADSVDRRLARLELEHDRLKLVTVALWELLKERHQLTEDALKRQLERVDLRDGRRDGKLAGGNGVKTCPDCHRPINKKALSCLYCGATLTRETGI